MGQRRRDCRGRARGARDRRHPRQDGGDAAGPRLFGRRAVTEPQGIAAARANAQQAKSRMLGTVDALKARLNPGTVAEDVAGRVKERASAAVEQGVAVVQREPRAVAAGAAGLFALFITPKLIRSLRRRCKQKRARAKVPATVASPEPPPAPPPAGS
ncbi:DUF3618 domain-containing protein [Sphingomonas sp. ABOLF]|nr:DUF3618 domain-containing protein [Sphingomonas sp. ABOLF]